MIPKVYIETGALFNFLDFVSKSIKNLNSFLYLWLDYSQSPEDRCTALQINGEYCRPATGETETPDGGCKQHYAIWKRNLGRNARG